MARVTRADDVPATAPAPREGGRRLRGALLVFAVALVVRLAFVGGFVDRYDRYETALDASARATHAMIKSDAGKYFDGAVRIGRAVADSGSWIVPSTMGPFLYPRLVALYGMVTGTVRYDTEGRVPAGAVTGVFLLQAIFVAACLGVRC